MNSKYKETYSYFLRLKSSVEEDAIRLQPRSSETHVFFPNSLGDDLLVEVQDSKGKHFGHVLVQVAAIADDPADKLCGWPIYHEPDHELVGKIQLYIIYSTSADDNSHLKVCLPTVVEEFLRQAKAAQLFMTSESFVFNDLLESDLSRALVGWIDLTCSSHLIHVY